MDMSFHPTHPKVSNYLSSTLRKIDPDIAYMTRIYASLGFHYMISVFPCFPFIAVLPIYSNVKAIVMGRTLPWAAMDAALSQVPPL